MKSFYLLLIFDALFVGFSVFMISIVLLRYFSASKEVLIIAISLSIIAIAIYVKRKLNKNKSSLLSKKEKRDLDETMLSLNFMVKKDLFKAFERFFKNSNVIFERKRDYFYLLDEKKIIYLSCGIDGAQKIDVVKVFNRLNRDDSGVIFCTSASPEVLSFAERFNGKIKLVFGKELYLKLKNANALPEKNTSILDPPKKPWDLRPVFSRKKARNYFLLGIAFLFMSFFVSIKLYYVLFGTIFTLFSLACRFFAPEK